MRIAGPVLAAVAAGCGPPADGESTTSLGLDARGRIPALSCPGAVGCERAEARFQAGLAFRDLTPGVEPFSDWSGDARWATGEPFRDVNANGRFDPVWLAGGARPRLAAGAADPLLVRALSLRKGDLRVVLVAADLRAIPQEDVLALRALVERRRLGVDHVLVVATGHAHGPDMLGLDGPEPDVSGRDEAYAREAVGRIAEAVAEAVRAEAPAGLRAGQADASALMVDARAPDVVDGRLTHVELHGERGGLVARVVVVGLRAEARAESSLRVAPDWPVYLASRLGPAERTLVLPGAIGGAPSPRGVVGCPDAEGRSRCPEGSLGKVQYVGDTLASIAAAALERGPRLDPDPILRARRSSTLLPVDGGRLLAGLRAGVVSRRLFDADGSRIEGPDDAPRVFLEAEVNLLALGPVELLLLPGEPFPELWIAAGPERWSLVERPWGADRPGAAIDPPLEALLDPESIRALVALAQDGLGPIIPEAQWDAEPPRAYVPEGQPGEDASLGPETASRLHRAVQDLLRSSSARRP